ncbi:MAG: hypothetical protein ACRCZM_01915 [Bacteroidales bacterium]
MRREISIKELLRTSWAIYKENILLLVGFFLGIIVVNMVLNIPFLGVTDTLSPLYIVGNILVLLVSVLGSMMQIKLNLKVIEGEEPPFLELFPSVGRFVKFVGASILIVIPWLIVAASSFSFIYPGLNEALGGSLELSTPSVTNIAITTLLLFAALYLTLFRFMFVPYLVVDQNLSPIQAIKRSWSMGNGSHINIILLVLLGIIAIVLGVVALMIGLFITMTYYQLVVTLFYRRTLNSEESANNLKDGE